MSVVGLGRGGMSVLSPFSTQLRTLAGALGTAEKCHYRTQGAAAKQRRHSIKSSTQTGSHSPNGIYGMCSRTANHSGLMLAARITLAHFSVSSAMKLAEVGGRARKHGAAQIGKPRLNLGIGEGGVDLVVELVDDLGRRALGTPTPYQLLAS